MTKKRDRHSTNLNKGLAEVVKQLAEKENRTFSGQVQTLIEEALTQRTGDREKAALTIKRLLHELSILELAEVIEISARLQTQKLQGGITKPGNSFEKLALENLVIFRQVFSEMPEELDRILKGCKPREEDLPLIASCVSMDFEEILEMYRKEFGNGNGEAANHQGCNG